METLTDRAKRLVRTMSSAEREEILHIFNEYVGPTDLIWQKRPPWPIPATELYVALMAERGF